MSPWEVTSFVHPQVFNVGRNKYDIKDMEMRKIQILHIATSTTKNPYTLDNNVSIELQHDTLLKKDKEMTYYDVLGASPTETHLQLRKRYIKLARQMHPDSNKGSKNYVDSFTQVTEAWKVLSDPKSRRRYDRQLQMEKFLDEIGTIFSTGIKVAIPFVKRTASTTMHVLENTSLLLVEMKDGAFRYDSHPSIVTDSHPIKSTSDIFQPSINLKSNRDSREIEIK